MAPSREFPGRRLLKVLIVGIDVLVLGLAAFIVVASLARGPLEWEAALGLGLPGLVLCAYLARLTNRTFSVLRVDAAGVAVSRFLGGTSVPWTEVATLFHWVEVHHVQGVATREPFAALMGADGKRILLLKSTYDAEMFQALEEFARAAGVRVELRPPPL